MMTIVPAADPPLAAVCGQADLPGEVHHIEADQSRSLAGFAPGPPEPMRRRRWSAPRARPELRYRTLASGNRERQVIGKAELTVGKPNPRTIVPDLSGAGDWTQDEAVFVRGAGLYERFYCGRGDVESSAAR